ncbi:aldehyde dehydrogenase family protein, partial [Streptomyces asiaticus]
MTSTALPTTDELRARARTALDTIGVEVAEGGDFSARTPLTGENLFGLTAATDADAEDAIAASRTAFLTWRTTPAPRRGELVRRLGELLREHKSDLADLVTIEAGKIRSEALGEIQEMIDICDFAVGLSRQLYGRTIASERPGHRLAETWHPLGVVGVISAFNFPAAVWSWNTAVALVCGDTVIWKPSELTPLISLACDHLLARAADEVGADRDV